MLFGSPQPPPPPPQGSSPSSAANGGTNLETAAGAVINNGDKVRISHKGEDPGGGGDGFEPPNPDSLRKTLEDVVRYVKGGVQKSTYGESSELCTNSQMGSRLRLNTPEKARKCVNVRTTHCPSCFSVLTPTWKFRK